MSNDSYPIWILFTEEKECTGGDEVDESEEEVVNPTPTTSPCKPNGPKKKPETLPSKMANEKTIKRSYHPFASAVMIYVLLPEAGIIFLSAKIGSPLHVRHRLDRSLVHPIQPNC